ncbi:MAG TPA: hypothetical protein VII69_02515 [Candidatus Eremiobacteraceae bacterium]
MAENASSILTHWSNFYILLGSAAASLTGLMFVVITLVMGTERRRQAEDGISTFSTPTVVHFGAALLLAAILSAPWDRLIDPAVLLGLVGICGVAYVSRLIYRTTRMNGYSADAEDWAWFSILPLVAYASIFAGAVDLPIDPAHALFVLALGAALLILIGIHNAWDIVTYIALGNAEKPPASK